MTPLPDLTPDSALFLDFDGTLVDIAETPEGVVVPPEMVESLRDLSGLLEGALAVVSGRQVDALDRFLAPLSLPAAGEHGVQRRDGHGQYTEGAAPDLALVLQAAHKLAAENPGVTVERKHAAVAVHYRKAPHWEDACRKALSDAVEDQPQFEVLFGKCVVEVKPAGVNKGIAIHAFMQETPFVGRKAFFFGDDTTDETGFQVLQPMGGVGVKVGDGPTCATWRVGSSAAVRHWLAAQRDRLTAEAAAERDKAGAAQTSAATASDAGARGHA